MAKLAERMTAIEAQSVCRKMFYIGLLFLPLLWLVNLIYFYPEWKRRNDEGETPSALADQDASPETISDPIANSKINTEPLAPIVGRYLVYSAVGVSIYAVVSSVWFALFVTHWVEWGAAAEAIMVVMPRGTLY